MEKTTRANIHFGAESYKALVNSKMLAGKNTFSDLIAEAVDIYIALQNEAVAGFTIIEVRNLDNHKRRQLKQKLIIKTELAEIESDNGIKPSGN